MDDSRPTNADSFHHLAFRPRDTKSRPNSIKSFRSINGSIDNALTVPRKRCPESLHFTSQLTTTSRLRSPTESSINSIPDSATTVSFCSLASPLSSSYANDLQDLFAGSMPASRILHRHQPSSGTCSTFVNDEDDRIVIDEYPDFADKIRTHPSVSPELADILPVSPSSDASIKQEDELDTPPSVDSEPVAQKWDNSSEGSAASEDCSTEDADAIIDYTLQLVYGVDRGDVSLCPATSRQLVHNLVRQVGQIMWQRPSDTQLTNGTMSSSTASSSSTPGGSTGSGDASQQRGGKRKKQANGGNGGEDDNGDDLTENEGDGLLPIKRPKPNPKEDETLRLSCPFRKRNPHRFNVRDSHSCSMTYFPKFAELRQHIVKQHKRDDPSAYVCDRCNRDFPSRKELRDHQRLSKEQMCDISDHDPESGIDGPTATKLLSRKRASGSSPEVQWREIWNILFPDDDDHQVQPYHFTPVIEHFEISNNYISAFNMLKTSLADKISNPATLETLATKFHQCFVETVQKCINDAQMMPYTNRSNKRSSAEQQPIHLSARNSVIPLARKPKDVLPRPDSGVVIDDGSEESGSVMMGLNNRDSVRTIRGRGSNLVPREPDVMPTILQAGTNGHMIPHPTPMTMSTTGPMDAAAVQAWNNGVMWDAAFGVPGQFTAGTTNLAHTDFGDWTDSLIHGNLGVGAMEDRFMGYNQR